MNTLYALLSKTCKDKSLTLLHYTRHCTLKRTSTINSLSWALGKKPDEKQNLAINGWQMLITIMRNQGSTINVV